MVRFHAIIYATFSFIALVLTFVAMFAGRHAGQGEQYHILTLNTSRIGANAYQNFADANDDPDNPLAPLFNNLTQPLTGGINSGLNSAIGSLAKDLHIQDFYSAHMFAGCNGTYTPQPVPDSDVPASKIHKNVTGCSKPSASFAFNPIQQIEDSMKQTQAGDTLTQINFPTNLSDELAAMKSAWHALVAFFILAVIFNFMSLFATWTGVVFVGRRVALLNAAIAGLNLFGVGTGTVIATAVGALGAKVINDAGNGVGLEGHAGHKFMALAWTATVFVGVVFVGWSVDWFLVRRREKREIKESPLVSQEEKPGTYS
ncbi:actin cortical patch SUR7/pH-response regulator pali [Phyllosticta citribraziliensis]|uniref:Actin cortical patch SUR7/pH-response regulator pali n=1 Tax=Phyllosticta citribraziliensis TaxID=989973 RepID=A0ABR1M5L1_9PEZI